MTWPKILVLALAAILGLWLHGGIYSLVAGPLGAPMRMNRITGQVEMFFDGRWRNLDQRPTPEP